MQPQRPSPAWMFGVNLIGSFKLHGAIELQSRGVPQISAKAAYTRGEDRASHCDWVWYIARMSDPAGSAPCAPERVAPGGRLYQPCVLPAGPISQSVRMSRWIPAVTASGTAFLTITTPSRSHVARSSAVKTLATTGNGLAAALVVVVGQTTSAGAAAHLQVESERIEAVCHAVARIQYS